MHDACPGAESWYLLVATSLAAMSLAAMSLAAKSLAANQLAANSLAAMSLAAIPREVRTLEAIWQEARTKVEDSQAAWGEEVRGEEERRLEAGVWEVKVKVELEEEGGEEGGWRLLLGLARSPRRHLHWTCSWCSYSLPNSRQ